MAARIELEIGSNVAPGTSEVKKLTTYVDELNKELDKASGTRDWESFDRLNTYIGNVQSRITEIQKAQQIQVQSQNQDDKRLQAEKKNGFNQVVNVGKGVGTILSSAGSGNIAGAIESTANTTSLLGAAGKAILSNPALGLIAAGVGTAWAGNKASQVWEQDAQNVIQSGTILNNDKFTQSVKERTETQREYFDRASEARRGTNTKTTDFLNIENQLAKSSNYENVNVTEQDAKAVNYASFNTGANKDQLVQLAGLQNLYGYKGAEAIQNAYRGLKESNMTDARFDEFLNGIQRVMEEGIEKGFVGSADTVARNLAMISTLSGNSAFWTGENGARAVEKVNSGFASAVDLGSTTDMMMYAAAKSLSEDTLKNVLGKDYVEGNKELNARLVMEQGLSGNAGMDMLKNYAQLLNANSPNEEFKIANIRQSFGLNVTQARQMMSILDKLANPQSTDKLPTKDDIINIIDSSKNKTAESNYYDNVQSIHDTMAKIGQGFFDVKSTIVDGIAKDTNGIYKFLTEPKEEVTEAKNIVNEIATSKEAADDINNKIQDHSKEIRIDNSSLDMGVKNRANATFVSNIAEETGHETEAVKAIVTGENGLSLMSGVINANTNLLGKFNQPNYGDDEVDDSAMGTMYPYLKLKNPDMPISDTDIQNFFIRNGDDKKLNEAYKQIENATTDEMRQSAIESFNNLWRGKLEKYFGRLPQTIQNNQEEMTEKKEEMLSQYATQGGGLRKNIFSKRKIDNVLSAEERETFDKTTENDKKLKDAYEKGDLEAYFARLTQILKSLFGSINVENAH